MLNRRNFLTAAVGVAAVGGLAACAKKDESPAGSSSAGGTKAITLGFSQVGAESGWRTREHHLDQGAPPRRPASS